MRVQGAGFRVQGSGCRVLESIDQIHHRLPRERFGFEVSGLFNFEAGPEP